MSACLQPASRVHSPCLVSTETQDCVRQASPRRAKSQSALLGKLLALAPLSLMPREFGSYFPFLGEVGFRLAKPVGQRGQRLKGFGYIEFFTGWIWVGGRHRCRGRVGAQIEVSGHCIDDTRTHDLLLIYE